MNFNLNFIVIRLNKINLTWLDRILYYTDLSDYNDQFLDDLSLYIMVKDNLSQKETINKSEAISLIKNKNENFKFIKYLAYGVGLAGSFVLILPLAASAAQHGIQTGDKKTWSEYGRKISSKAKQTSYKLYNLVSKNKIIVGVISTVVTIGITSIIIVSSPSRTSFPAPMEPSCKQKVLKRENSHQIQVYKNRKDVVFPQNRQNLNKKTEMGKQVQLYNKPTNGEILQPGNKGQFQKGLQKVNVYKKERFLAPLNRNANLLLPGRAYDPGHMPGVIAANKRNRFQDQLDIIIIIHMLAERHAAEAQNNTK